MNTPTDLHTPSPDFRATLEANLRAAIRREQRFPTEARVSRHPRWRTAALLAFGLVLGAGGQFASAQVRDARAQAALDSALAADRALAALRVQVAREAHESARADFEVGTLSRQSLLEAAAALRAAELAYAAVELTAAEAHASAASPRDELWAPLVNGRDFVRERLLLRAAAAQDRLTAAERVAEDANRAHAVGAMTQAQLRDAQFEAAQAKHEFQVLAQLVQLRDAFHRDALTPSIVTRRMRDIELTADVMRVQQLLERAKARVASAQERAAVGAAVALDVKRAELEVLERSIELERLLVRLRRAAPPEP